MGVLVSIQGWGIVLSRQQPSRFLYDGSATADAPIPAAAKIMKKANEPQRSRGAARQPEPTDTRIHGVAQPDAQHRSPSFALAIELADLSWSAFVELLDATAAATNEQWGNAIKAVVMAVIRAAAVAFVMGEWTRDRAERLRSIVQRFHANDPLVAAEAILDANPEAELCSAGGRLVTCDDFAVRDLHAIGVDPCGESWDRSYMMRSICAAGDVKTGEFIASRPRIAPSQEELT